MRKKGWRKMSDSDEIRIGQVQDCPVLPRKLIAKKDFLISHNDYEVKIKAGDDLSGVPELYHENLRTENVI